MTDLWGLCPTCERWFFCTRQDPPPTCPVCRSEPSEIRERV